ncbi:50S ribosomal protein L5 [Candidatus Nomurabacteria bacterium RIFCSPHIGHO2_02_FULL_37_45]|uniref:Large ribosomal subunit protein uL5 n=2 Tax=Candidatus Nomuraibacteriota TaxID=1752729 RepID=A0A1F6Y3D8_9BACT|nr:MAG: 50S ribosomal protein L5 [Candidatus Nomurabacteria bacterium RIFCSPHIGHO2_01_FULL_37_110]OGI72337.1 MAG: 50S ribosomal protein L5 [Candidatus Nomurabacteria bacterium RIFCSPHIGHO2_02_FULL_37_45]OGI79219.1 MAG: 50S ribosomal protein L5 [Candidatus Nomurabacteria bacterium RIFCSPHIGHO2_12_FULL_37_29]OGI85075.1 MAG: 50S ribosomal protein L5 [Candidatus Nomurabacteria bacterium RIFCSPLOWO2_01_FULL_37_49]OGJ00852.1 MAG: 50S ribosomal protein L5 [Candidatus Nomurabacteria bacterium RIFCSPLOW
MKHLTVKEKEVQAFEKMKISFHYKNAMAASRMVKVVINTGTGTVIKKDKNKNEAILERLAKISGQKGSLKGAKQSIASFKIRQGDPIGIVVTLRGNRMYTFLEKLINVALPRTKDFRGIARTAVDNIGNLTIGIKEHTIFPETADEDIKDIFGMSITLVSTAKNKKEGVAFFGFLGIPFKKEEPIHLVDGEKKK